MELIADENACYGCRLCEVICSYRHRGVFCTEGGSIRVQKDNSTGRIRLFIDSTCDLCKGRGIPLCIRYCSYGALKLFEEGKESADRRN